MTNTVFIATSLDGFIADKNNSIDWLHQIPNPKGIDMGYGDLMKRVDALVMGRNTMEIVLGFGIDWPYEKPVFVLSNTLKEVPAQLEGKVFLICGELLDIQHQLNEKGYQHLYIDGGLTIQNFLKQDMIDELIITTIPVLLGAGVPLFGDLDRPLNFKHIKSEQFLDSVVQNTFKRERLLN